MYRIQYSKEISNISSKASFYKLIFTKHSTERLEINSAFSFLFLRSFLGNSIGVTYSHIKGAIELGSTIGSVLGLAILAPQVSHAFIHPALKFLGMEEKKPNETNKQATQQLPKHVDTKA